MFQHLTSSRFLRLFVGLYLVLFIPTNAFAQDVSPDWTKTSSSEMTEALLRYSGQNEFVIPSEEFVADLQTAIDDALLTCSEANSTLEIHTCQRKIQFAYDLMGDISADGLITFTGYISPIELQKGNSTRDYVDCGIASLGIWLGIFSACKSVLPSPDPYTTGACAVLSSTYTVGVAVVCASGIEPPENQGSVRTELQCKQEWDDYCGGFGCAVLPAVLPEGEGGDSLTSWCGPAVRCDQRCEGPSDPQTTPTPRPSTDPTPRPPKPPTRTPTPAPTCISSSQCAEWIGHGCCSDKVVDDPAPPLDPVIVCGNDTMTSSDRSELTMCESIECNSYDYVEECY